MDRPEPPDASPEPDPAGDALRRLEARLDRASEAAERLLAEAAARLGRAGQATGGAGQAAGHAGEAPASPHQPGLAGQPASQEAGPPPPPPRDEDQPPPAGWQIPGQDGAAHSRDLELLASVIQSLRDLIPPELQRRLAEALRELLLALRALIDWYLERMDRRRSEPAEVQDIPIQ